MHFNFMAGIENNPAVQLLLILNPVYTVPDPHGHDIILDSF